MDIPVDLIRQLLEELSQKTGYPLEYSHFNSMAEEIGAGVSGKYLYDNLYRAVNAQSGKGKSLGVQPNKLNLIAAFLGYKGIHHYIREKTGPTDRILKGFVGNYLCYVRRNSEEMVVFCSPVRIYQQQGPYLFELRGPQWLYSGEVKHVKGCLFVTLRNNEGKEFHHVYKIGAREKPGVLQGIFSGVSTTFDPIGGRVVLVPSNEKYEKLKGAELSLKNLGTMGSFGKKLAVYFKYYGDNNLQIKKVVTFSEADL